LVFSEYCKNGKWSEVFHILNEQPQWVNLRNPLSYSGYFPIHQAAWWGNLDACKRLVQLGASPRAKTSQDQTAVDIARSRHYNAVADYLEQQIQHHYDSQPPNEFLCPITKELMSNPVILCDGHTFEKESIEKWFEESTHSPLTGLELHNKDTVPNIALKKLIEDWKKLHMID